MLNRLLLALDQFDTGQAALEFTGQVAHATHASVRVLHVRELEMLGRVPALETVEEAERLVREAVFRLRLNGVPADGRVRSLRDQQVACGIAEEADWWQCDAIVLGSRRLHGVNRLAGHGVRERVLRQSLIPVLVAPTPGAVEVDHVGEPLDTCERLRTPSPRRQRHRRNTGRFGTTASPLGEERG